MTTTNQWVRDSLIDEPAYRSGLRAWPGSEYIGERWLDDGCVFVLCEDHDRHDWVADWARSSICHTKQQVDYKTNPKYAYWYTTMNVHAGPKLSYEICAHESSGVSHWTLLKLTDTPQLDLSAAATVRGLGTLLGRSEIDAGDEDVERVRIQQGVCEIYQQLLGIWEDCGKNGVALNVALSLLEENAEIDVTQAVAAGIAVCSDHTGV